MSYTEIYAFDKNGNAYMFGEVQNSWRGAMKVWTELEKKYLPSLPRPSWSTINEEPNKYWSRMCMSFDPNAKSEMKKVWNLDSTHPLSDVEKIA